MLPNFEGIEREKKTRFLEKGIESLPQTLIFLSLNLRNLYIVDL